MRYFKELVIVLTFFLGFISFAQSESNWITKKNDKAKKVEKVVKVKKETSKNWIKKKEVKENKKKLQEKIKDSKSWITKKSKEKIGNIKKKLKKHKAIEDLPKAELYFAVGIIPNNENEEIKYLYGYFNKDKESKKQKKFKFENKSFYIFNDGIAYFEDKKNRCEVNVKQNFDKNVGLFIRNVAINCKKKYQITGTFAKTNYSGKFDGEATGGNTVKFEIYPSKSTLLTEQKNFKKTVGDYHFAKGGGLLAPTNPPENLKLTPSGKYYALLIGNSDYSASTWASLTSPVNDVTEIAKVLRTNYNFADVKVLKNVERHELFKALKELRKVVTPEDYLLIYYSGHGDQDANQAYWIPINAEKEWDENWIDTITITAAIQRIKTKHTLLMIDSCYVGTSFKGNENDFDEIKNTERSLKIAKKGLLNRAGIVIASGSTTSVIDTAVDDKHSLFAYKFLDLLKKNTSFMTSTTLFVKLYEYHVELDQTPQRYFVRNWGHLDGDFVFVAK